MGHVLKLLIASSFAGSSVALAQAIIPHGFFRTQCVFSSPVNLTISANTQNYNIFLAAGGCSGPATVTLTINSGVTVGSTSTSMPALDTGTFAAGSTISIVNNGTIVGAGGTGGAGGNGPNATGKVGNPGSDGGPAIALHMPVTITNNGNIWGGGGGGGGGSGD